MDWIIRPARKLSGTVTPPPDKSITHRAIMLAALAEGESVIENYLEGEDCIATLRAFQDMGVAVEREPGVLRIRGAGRAGLRSPEKAVDAGNSGTTTRLLAGILAGQNVTATITGDASLSARPMKRIIEPLRRMGADISARDDNFLPLTIRGKQNLTPIDYTSPVASAQVKSCILLAGLHAKGTTTVREPVVSRDHTERMLAAAGVSVKKEGNAVSITGPALVRPQHMRIPADISSAAFFLVAGVLVRNSRISVLDTGVNPTRDGILEVLRTMGADLTLAGMSTVSGEPTSTLEVKTSALRATAISREIIPRLIDELPILALAATQAQGETVISGAGELRHKESDRIKTIAAELVKMGARIEERPDGLVIHGPMPLHGAVGESYGDHRVAMMLAVAGLIAEGETTIRNVDCVATSFPGFLPLLTGLAR